MATLSPRGDAVYDEALTPPVDNEKALANQKRATTGWGRVWNFYNSVYGIMTGAVIGIIIGCVCQPSHPSETTYTWIGTFGKLFIRAIKCLVSPLVFCSLVVGMADMLAVGKAGRIGWRAAALYTTTTVVAAVEGLIWVVIFRPLFSGQADEPADTTPKMAFECGEDGYYLMADSDGEVMCEFDDAFNATGTHGNSSVFMAKDINGFFAASTAKYSTRTVTEALQSQLDAIVPDNITQAFANATLLSIICFAIPLGVAISMLPANMKLLANFFREINDVFMKMIQWVIMCTPIALVSLLAKTVMSQEDLGVVFVDVGYFVLCSVIAMLIHLFVFYPALLRAFVPENPFIYMRHIVPAQVFAFSCASSMATLPLTMKCVDASQKVSRTLSRFILSLGATINMDGAAICYPINIVFMAEASGMGHLIGGVEYFMIILVSTVGAIGAGPVPAASIVMTMTIWSSVFPDVDLPSTFAFIVATDWLLDRFHTATNVTGDTIVARIIADMVDENTLDNFERENMDSAVDGMSARHSVKSGM